MRHAPRVSLGAGALPEIYRQSAAHQISSSFPSLSLVLPSLRTDLRAAVHQLHAPAVITSGSRYSRGSDCSATALITGWTLEPDSQHVEDGGGGWGGGDWERGHSFWNYYSHHVLLSAPSAGSVVQVVCQDSTKTKYGFLLTLWTDLFNLSKIGQ